MRTFSRDTFLEAKAAWDGGSFGWQWKRIRALAAERGFLYPPSGTVHDDRESGAPSQRAIVWRALQDNPTELERIVRRSRSWSEVVDGIIGMEARLWVDVAISERDDDWQRKSDLGPREAAMTLKQIFARIQDS